MSNNHTTELVFSDYEKLIWKVVHLKVNSTGGRSKRDQRVLAEDLYGEACIVYVQCLSSWSPEKKCKFSSWLYMQIEYNLRNYINRKISKDNALEDLDDFEDGGDYYELETADVGSFANVIKIEKVFGWAFNRWKFEKTAFLFFVLAYDESGESNPYLINFVEKYSVDLMDAGFDLSVYIDYYFCLDDLHIFFSGDYFKGDSRSKLSNNVRNSVKYILKKIN
jgi:hypothetical protein